MSQDTTLDEITFEEIQKIVVLSTSHITKDDNETLRALAAADLADGCQPLMVAAYYGGYLIRLLEEMKEQAGKANLSAACGDLLAIMETNGADWLRLDCDGPVAAELPIFDW